MQQGKKLRKALAGKGLVTAPGVYDMISAKIADGLGFSALYMTGYGVSASLGLPDAGLASYTEMVERVAQICQGTTTPVICDADTGFGGLLNVERTVQGLRAGRRRGHPDRGPGVPQEMRAHAGPARGAHRADGAQDRGGGGEPLLARLSHRRPHRRAHQPRARRGAAARGGLRQGRRRHPVHRKPGERGGDGEASAGISMCRCSPTWPTAGARRSCPRSGWRSWATSIAIFPATGFLAAAKTLERVYGVLKDKGSSDTLGAEFYPFDKFCRLVGFEHVWEFDKRWPEA